MLSSANAVARPVLPPGVPLELRVVFRSLGTQWPLRDGDQIEVWDRMSHDVHLIIQGDLLKRIILHHVEAVMVQTQLTRAHLHKPPVKLLDAPPPEKNPVSHARKESLREQRRSRKRFSG